MTGYIETGQRACYDASGSKIPCAGSGQDAEFRAGRSWPAPRFDAHGEQVVDRLTGLVWTQDASLAQFPLGWQEAFDFVARLNHEGAMGCFDWRLPNRRELRSLLSHQATRPVLPPDQPFRNVFAGWYWTSTSAAISPAHAWYIDMHGGRMFYGGKDQSFMVWPVRGRSPVLPASGQTRCYDEQGAVSDCVGSGQDAERRLGMSWPAPRFEPRADAVLDRLTGLVWRRAADVVGAAPWDDALGVVADLNRAESVRRWRLPNINELESLVDCDRHSPALPAGHPFAAVGETYWSSTTSVYEPDWAWALYLDKGAIGVGQKRYARFHVWAVSEQDFE